MVVVEAFENPDLLDVMNLAARVLPERYTYDFFLKLAATQGQFFRVARDEANGQLIGFVVGAREPGLQGNVLLLAVDPEHQGQRVGHALLRDVQRLFALNDVRSVRLEVRADNERALAFYQREGFAVEGLEPNAYRDGSDAFALRKPLL